MYVFYLIFAKIIEFTNKNELDKKVISNLFRNHNITRDLKENIKVNYNNRSEIITGQGGSDNCLVDVGNITYLRLDLDFKPENNNILVYNSKFLFNF